MLLVHSLSSTYIDVLSVLVWALCLQFEGGKHPDPDMVGLMQRSFTYLLQQAESVAGNKVIRASYLEIYNEQVIYMFHREQINFSMNRYIYMSSIKMF